LSKPDLESLRLVTAEELAELFGMSKQSIYRRVRRGELPVVRTGARQIRFNVGDVERWLGVRTTTRPRGTRS
jgi:excisionase family DNA binding protein